MMFRSITVYGEAQAPVSMSLRPLDLFENDDCQFEKECHCKQDDLVADLLQHAGRMELHVMHQP
jgi:hypothetical protein